jgi:hypothetical protein
MNKELLKKFRHYQAKEKGLRKARQDRDSSRLQLSENIHALMRENGLSRRDVFNRLNLITYVQIGNVLHLSQSLPSEKAWLELMKAVSEPKNKK